MGIRRFGARQVIVGRGWRLLATMIFASTFLSACAGAPPAPDRRAAAAEESMASNGIFVPGLAPFPEWTSMLARYDQALQSPDQVPPEWTRLVEALQGLDPRAKIERANAEMNRYPYVTSEQNWGRPDYWETPFEFFAKSGQCQDYATAKYMLLRAAGVPGEMLRIVVAWDRETRQNHAVLVAYLNNEALLMDNQVARVTLVQQAKRYRPLYALSESGWWAFRSGEKAAQLAQVRSN